MKKTVLNYLGILIILGLATVAWLLLPSATEDFEDPRAINIAPGSNFSDVTDSLVAHDILAADGRFRFVAKVTGWHRQIKAGHYLIAPGTSIYKLLDILRRGLQIPLRVTVPPGTRTSVFAAVVQKELGVDSADVQRALSDPALAASLGTDTVHLFGYMLPETVDFFWGTSADQVVTRMKHAFDSFFSERMKERAEEIGLSVDEVITLASIVEWEARVDSERATIAGVYLNRLRKHMPLQADPTVQYAIMKTQGGRMRRLVFADYKMEHPYNTYLYYGLPPGPITNPSKASIRAVLHPQHHKYLYFVADGNGGHIFSRTLREHNNAANSYREMMRERRKQPADSE
ncbi:MAG: endolytic transglycosylase MltG [Rhodothermales bacterium]